MRKKKKSNTVLLILIFVAGLSLLLYPSLSDYWNSMHQSQAIASYAEEVATLSEENYDSVLQDAREYNAQILSRENVFKPSEQEKQAYEAALNLSGNGMIGYIEIPSIEVMLPIFHGTSNAVLRTSIGHLNWTSLPVGGLNTHCVLSGHRGLPSAKLFTNLDKLVEGDVFMLRILNEVLTYEVDQILIVLPENTSPLQIEKGEDYCTLVTCTPYGINTHRLLVRGHRIENTEVASAVRITADALQVEELIVAPILAVPLLLIILTGVLIAPKTRKRK